MSGAGIVALTGVTGFLGPHVARSLAARGWALRILTRRHPRLAGIEGAVDVVAGELGDADALARLVAGADAIVHLAGAIKARDEAAFMAANAEATARLAAAWRRAAPGAHFVLVSSMAAREPGLSSYAASKREGEARLVDAAGRDGRATILRPAAVYGPGDRATLPLFRAARLPFQPVLGRPGSRVCLVHAEDVAAAVAAALAQSRGGAVWELTDARLDGYSWPEIAALAARAAGRSGRPVRIPEPVLAALGRGGDLLAAATGRAGMLTSAKAREILHPDWSSDAGRQPPAATWRPRVSIEDGFASTVDWYRRHGLL